MEYGHFHLFRYVFKSHKVFGIVSTEVFQLIAVVIDKPTGFIVWRFSICCFRVKFQYCGTFHHLAGKGLGSLRPRTVGRLAISYLDVTLGTGVVL